MDLLTWLGSMTERKTTPKETPTRKLPDDWKERPPEEAARLWADAYGRDDGERAGMVLILKMVRK